MISLDSLKKDEVLNSTRIFKKADPSIMELVIHAFYLLEKLSIHKLDFVFKGGTCLMLHFSPPLRFSTDIDITTIQSKGEIEDILDIIIRESEFIRWELDDRRSYKPGIPKAHYKMLFISDLQGKEREILLDILFEDTLYPKLENVEISVPFINSTKERIEINIPSTNALLGDKLTAFAPGTIGIHFNRNKGRDIVKQVFDIGSLFSRITDLEELSETFSIIAGKESKYRDLKISDKDIAVDVFGTTIFFAKVFRNMVNSVDKEKEKEIKAALRSFIPFTASSRVYIIDSLLLDASIASYLTALIASGEIERFRVFEPGSDDLRKYFFLDAEYNFLNKLSRIPNGTLYYLKSAYNLLYE